MSYLSLPNCSMVFENRRLSSHDDLILYTLSMTLTMARQSKLFESVFVKYGKNCIYQKYIVVNVYRLPLCGVDDLTLFTYEYTIFFKSTKSSI